MPRSSLKSQFNESVPAADPQHVEAPASPLAGPSQEQDGTRGDDSTPGSGVDGHARGWSLSPDISTGNEGGAGLESGLPGVESSPFFRPIVKLPRLRCGWCKRLLRGGSLPESTGICIPCRDAMRPDKFVQSPSDSWRSE